MINLNTCFKGQKLRLRNRTVVTYVGSGWSSEYPHETRTVHGERLTYTCNGNYRTDGDFSTLNVVEILPLETANKHPSIAWWESCPWITDRKPTKEDGDASGWVIIKAIDNFKVLTACWENVQAGQPWVHRLHWQPSILTDKEQALQLLDDHRDGWRPTPEQWHIIRKGLEAS